MMRLSRVLAHQIHTMTCHLDQPYQALMEQLSHVYKISAFDLRGAGYIVKVALRYQLTYHTAYHMPLEQVCGAQC